MDFGNSTKLDSERLHAAFVRHTRPFRHERLKVRVRYSRGAEFSGTCYYTQARIFVNLGRRNRYPYTLATSIAKAQSSRTHWWRPTYHVTVADGYQLALFVYLHELYHYLVKMAGRSPRQKEAMCDRFATRVLVDQYGCAVRDKWGRAVDRDTWDFKDLHGFVMAAPQQRPAPRAARREIPVTIRGV